MCCFTISSLICVAGYHMWETCTCEANLTYMPSGAHMVIAAEILVVSVGTCPFDTHSFMSGMCHANGDKFIPPHLCRAHVLRETMPVCIVIVFWHTRHPLDVSTMTCAHAHMCAAPHHSTVQLHYQHTPSHPHDYQQMMRMCAKPTHTFAMGPTPVVGIPTVCIRSAT